MKIPSKKHLIFIFLTIQLTCCYQSIKAQSISESVILKETDTLAINKLNELGWELMFNNPDTSIILGNQALSIAEEIKWKKGIANSSRNLGVYYYLTDDGTKALEYFMKALTIEEELGNENGIARTLNNIGLVYYEQGEYPRALDYYSETLKIDEKLGDKSGMAATMGNIGNIYEKHLDYQRALDYHSRALAISLELGDKNNCASEYSNIGTIYHDLSDYEKALEYYSKAAEISEEIGNSNTLGRVLGNIGVVYIEMDNFPKALDYCNKALEIANELNDKDLISIELIAIGDVFFEKGKQKEAEKYYKKALAISNEIGTRETSVKINKDLSWVYQKMGQFELALKYYTAAMDLKDTVFNENRDKEITRKEMNYEFDKKEAAKKAEQEKKDILTAAELKRRMLQRNYFIFGFFILCILLFFVFKEYREKQKANIIISKQKLEVEKQKQIIEEKNKGILDSITYARRIQQAKLPNKEEIFSALPESFILFKPKDIVSGDFYFFHKRDNHVIIAAADCTGHGVPGALMSMVGSEQLNEAVLGSDDTSNILKQLNKGMKKSLRQSDNEESTRDGMDIAVCAINLENNFIQYAGANRPFWLIKKGQQLVEEFEATRKAIGGLTDNEQHFETTDMKLQKGDTFYIFTDGFADQFGGESGKKLMAKRLKEILLSIQTISLKEQEKYLENFIENWKNGNEQIDDILIIGVRIT